jgi:RNA polymerase sigma factor (sigma-70 family)
MTTTDSLSTYISLAKKTISKFAPKFYNGLSTEMLKNEEAISDVATAIMYADWRFDPNRMGKSGQQKTLYSYRNQCAIWAIQTYVTNKYKKRKHYSIDSIASDDMSHAENIPDHRQDNPLENLIEQEENFILCESIDKLLNSSLLSDKQQQQIKMYYFEDKTLSEIGKVFGVSREAVRQNIKRGLDIIRSHDGV